MKRHDSSILVVLCLMVLFALEARAELTINHMNINVVLQADGSATFTEVWDVNVGESGYTEFFLKRPKTLGDIKDFSVSEQGKQFTEVETWNSKADDKSNLCNLTLANGAHEMCWGIGQHGHHRYTINYTLTTVLRPYGTNALLDFIPIEGSELGPKSATVTVSRADSVLTESDVRQFQTNDGNVEAAFKNGCFTLTTKRPMVSNDYMRLSIEFEASAFSKMDYSGTSTNISDEELSSPMMSESNARVYDEGSWFDKFWDFYDEWPLLTLCSILFGILALFYIVKKIAIALA